MYDEKWKRDSFIFLNREEIGILVLGLKKSEIPKSKLGNIDSQNENSHEYRMKNDL